MPKNDEHKPIFGPHEFQMALTSKPNIKNWWDLHCCDCNGPNCVKMVLAIFGHYGHQKFNDGDDGQNDQMHFFLRYYDSPMIFSWFWPLAI